MNDEQRALIYELTRDDAVRLIESRDIGTWKYICRNIQELYGVQKSDWCPEEDLNLHLLT